MILDQIYLPQRLMPNSCIFSSPFWFLGLGGGYLEKKIQNLIKTLIFNIFGSKKTVSEMKMKITPPHLYQ